MRRNPAPPYPNANLSAAENRRLLQRWAIFGERWLKAINQRLNAKNARFFSSPTFQGMLLTVKDTLGRIRDGDPTDPAVRKSVGFLRLALRSMDSQIHLDQRTSAKHKREARGRIEEALSESDLHRFRGMIQKPAMVWPTAYKNNKLRFTRVVLKAIKSNRTSAHPPEVSAEQLLAAGIPVRDLAPWHDDPKKFLAQTKAYYSLWGWTTEYDVGAWMHDIGLDEYDGPLRGAISRMATAGGTFRRPSRQEAYRIKNQLEEDRRKSEDQEKGPAIQKWLDASETYRKHGTIDPGSIRLGLGKPIDLDLPPGWHQVTDADEVLRRSRADGLCLADTLAGSPFGEDEDQDGELSADALAFIVAQDRGKTVVGLNKNGVVRNRHHCTGKDNKFDKDAWDIFSKPRARRNPPSGYRVKLRRGRRLLHVVIR